MHIYNAPDGSKWQVEQFRLLASRFRVKLPQLAQFHEYASPVPGWCALRLYTGMHPVDPVPDDPVPRGFALPLADVAKALKCNPQTMLNQWAALRESWMKHNAAIEANLEHKTHVQEMTEIGSEEDCRDTIKRFGFSESLFRLPNRPPEDKEIERFWFAGRLLELRRPFEDPGASGLARQAIINELHLRRCDEALAKEPPDSDGFGVLQKRKTSIEEEYRAQWEQLKELHPGLTIATSKVIVAGMISDLLKGMQKWNAYRNNDIIDGWFTDYGLQIEHRVSRQVPEVRYRPEWVLAMMEAKEGLWDPSWKPKIPKRVARMMSGAYQSVVTSLIESGQIRVPNIEADGPSGEYDPLEPQAETEGEAEVPEPTEPVPME